MSNNLLEELCINEDNNICEKEEEGVNECNHYNRLCYIVAECCNKIYSCRLCHDLEMYDWQKEHKPNLTGSNKAYSPKGNTDAIKKKYNTWKN